MLQNYSKPQTERFWGLEKNMFSSKSFNSLYSTRFATSVQLGGFLPLLCSKICSIQEIMDQIEIYRSDRHIQLEIVQLEALPQWSQFLYEGAIVLHVCIQKYMIMNVYITNLAEVVETVQNWVHNLHFRLYLSQFLTDFKNSFFP